MKTTSDVSGGDLVYLFTGEFCESMTDLVIPGIGIDFKLSRTYRSRVRETNSGLGPKWDWSYNIITLPLPQ